MTSVRRCEVVGLSEVYELSYELSQRVRRADFAPDVVIAIARGGFVPARLVCDFFRCRDLRSLGIRHYAAGARPEDRTRVSCPLEADLRDRRVLVVDDVNDSGDTIEAARAHLAASGAAELRVAVLHEKEHSRTRADFRAAVASSQRWLVYEWALVEDALGFLEQLEPAAASDLEGRSRLASEFGIALDDAHWAKVRGSLPREPEGGGGSGD